MPEAWRLRSLQPSDSEVVRTIFNFYVEHSFAAYAQSLLSMNEIQDLLVQCNGYPALAADDEAGNLIGFGFLRPYSPHDTFSKAATITYFIASEHTGRGLGSAFLQSLEAEAQKRGIRNLLAHVSSKNPRSLSFHRKHGFRQCGCFHGIGCKHGECFDVVWFEKSLS